MGAANFGLMTERNTSFLEASGTVGKEMLPVYLGAAAVSSPVAKSVVVKEIAPELAAPGLIAYHLRSNYRNEVGLHLGESFTPYDRFMRERPWLVGLVAMYSGLDARRVSVPVFASFIAGHEFGHVDDMEGKSVEEVEKIRRAELKTLPFPGLDPSQLENRLQNISKNWTGYVEKFGLFELGIGNPRQLLFEQRRQYQALPSEVAAHEFSGRIIADIYN